jgi:hypothetical protein
METVTGTKSSQDLFGEIRWWILQQKCKLIYPLLKNSAFNLLMTAIIPVLLAIAVIVGGILLYTNVLNISPDKLYKLRKYVNRPLIGVICLYIWVFLYTGFIKCSAGTPGEVWLNPANTDNYSSPTIAQKIKWLLFSPNFLFVIYGLVYMTLYTNVFRINSKLRREIRKYFEPIFILVSSVLICGGWGILRGTALLSRSAKSIIRD